MRKRTHAYCLISCLSFMSANGTATASDCNKENKIRSDLMEKFFAIDSKKGDKIYQSFQSGGIVKYTRTYCAYLARKYRATEMVVNQNDRHPECFDINGLDVWRNDVKRYANDYAERCN